MAPVQNSRNIRTGINRRNFIKSVAAVSTVSLAAGSFPYADAGQSQNGKRQWIDTHTHVSDLDKNGNKNARFFSDLMNVLDGCDANLRFVISPDGEYVKRMITDPAAMLAANRMIYNLCKLAPGRLYGSCMVNPNFPDESLKVMKTCFEEWNFVQLGEMKPYELNYRFNSDSTEKIVRLAAKCGKPVQVHLGTWWCRDSVPFGPSDGMNQMSDLLSITERVPEAKYILAHAIGGKGPGSKCISWADMYLDTLKGLFSQFPDNFWVEICNFQCPAVSRALREVPVTHLLSGTDWTTRKGPPFQSYGTLFGYREKENPFIPKVDSLVGFLEKAGANASDIDKIGYLNALELYRIKS